MAIQPIDIQTLFSQLEKVSRTQVHQQQGLQLQNAIQQEEQMKKNLEKKSTVEQADQIADGVVTVREREQAADGGHEGGGKKKRDQDDAPAESAPAETITDPCLGRHVDLSG